MEDVGKALDTIALQAVRCVPARAKGFAPAGATKGLSDRPLETFGAHACGCFCGLRKRKAFLLRFSLERQTRPGSLQSRGVPDCQKTFGRRRRGRSPSDFHSYPAALPMGRVVDFACKINSLQLRTSSGWPKLLSRKRGENHFCDTLERWQELKEQTAP